MFAALLESSMNAPAAIFLQLAGCIINTPLETEGQHMFDDVLPTSNTCHRLYANQQSDPIQFPHPTYNTKCIVELERTPSWGFHYRFLPRRKAVTIDRVKKKKHPLGTEKRNSCGGQVLKVKQVSPILVSFSSVCVWLESNLCARAQARSS